MKIVIPYQRGLSLDGNERSIGLNDVHCNPTYVNGPTVASMVFKS